MSQESGVRVYYFDYLRVLGVLAVIILHIAASGCYSNDVNSFEWNVFNFYDSIVRWAVPVYVMISGALFLGRDVPLSKIYGKNILRIVTAFIFWSFVYAARTYIKTGDLTGFIKNFMSGHFHLWFLFMITGLYMIVPFMKKIAESKFLTKYFLVLSLIFAFILPQLIDIFSSFTNFSGDLLRGMLENSNMHFVIGYSSYFLLGYYLNNLDISPRLTRIIYFAGIIGFAGTILLTLYASRFNNNFVHSFYIKSTVNVLLESIAIFVFCKKNFNRPSKFIRTLSQYSFGAYLVHAAGLMLVGKIGMNNLLNPVIYVPVTAIFIFIVSFIVSGILNHIPVLNKYIV